MSESFKNQLIDIAMDRPEYYSLFQMSNFVLKTQITDYRILKQALLELESRAQMVYTMGINIRRYEAELEQYDEQIEAHTGSPAGKKLLMLDRERVEYDMRVTKKRQQQVQSEVDQLAGIVEAAYGTTDNVIAELTTDVEHKEREYWISRLGKQAAMDMIAYGRIGVGNMDAIANMKEADQAATLTNALQYTNKLNRGMLALEKNIEQQLLAQQKEIDSAPIPLISDKPIKVELQDVLGNVQGEDDVQRTIKSKIKPEAV